MSRRMNLSAQSCLTLPGRAIQAPGPRCQPERVPYSAATSRNTLENLGILDEDVRDMAGGIEDMPEQRCAVIDRQASPDVSRVTRRDVKRESAIRESGRRR